MGGAKTACAFVPEKYPPMGADADGRGRFPMGGVRCAVFSPIQTAKKSFKKIEKSY